MLHEHQPSPLRHSYENPAAQANATQPQQPHLQHYHAQASANVASQPKQQAEQVATAAVEAAGQPDLLRQGKFDYVPVAAGKNGTPPNPELYAHVRRE